jgi:outer membrane protein
MTPLLALVVLAQAAAPVAAPLSLDEALAKAQSNPRLAALRATASQARHRIDEMRAGWFPTANAQLGYSRATGNYTPQPGLNLRGTTVEASNDNFPFYSAAINASQTVWDFGRTTANVETARAQADVAGAEIAVTGADLALAVRVAFHTVLGAEAMQRAAAENVGAQERHVREAQQLVDAGRKPPYDVSRARIELGNAKVALVRAQNEAQLARADLSNAIGEPVGERALVPVDGAPQTPTLDEALQQALSSRTEFSQLDARLRAQASQLEGARKSYWPSLGVNGQFNFRGAAFPLVYNWQLGASLTVPIVNGGADAARIEEHAAAREALQRSLEALALDVRRDVEKQLLVVTEAAERETLAREVVQQSREAVAFAEGRYQAGVATMVELADAQAALTNAIAQEIRARFDWFVARARLQRMTGE